MTTAQMKEGHSIQKSIDLYKSLIEKAIGIFAANQYSVKFIKSTDIKKLAEFIDIILGEYNYYTSINSCYCTLSDAIINKYMYVRNGRPRLMDEDAVLEWVYFHNPELEDGFDMDKVQELRAKYLYSDNIYKFHKIDTTEVNVYRRMTRKNNTPEAFMLRNINGLSKTKNGHLKAEETITRIHLRNSYVSLLELWKIGIIPVLEIREHQTEN